ncbi:uncharacterized protein TNCV_2915041 [Trichonephila clavipes]|nr:uncharacterized protein TNCV_2915041 [Trichonephila clavipes]
MSEKTLVDHILVRSELQVQDYVEVRNPENMVQLLEVLAKFEESRQRNQWFQSRNRFQKNDRRFNDRRYQFRNRGQNDDFSRGDHRNRGSSENFSRVDRRQRRRLNILKVSDVQSDQTQSINEVPIKLSATCMSPVELPYVPILLNETFTKALWDTGAEKSFISEETYRKYFFISKEFEKPWLLHVLADLEYLCILGIDFIGESKIILDFDQKALAIQDSQVEDIKVDEGNLRVDVSETKLNVVANVPDKNPVESIIGEKVNCAIIRDLVLSSRE